MVSVPSSGSTSTRRCSLASTGPAAPTPARAAGPGTVDRRGTCASRSRARRRPRTRPPAPAPGAGGSRWSRRPRPARAARFAGRLEVDRRLAGRGVVQRELDDAVVARGGRSTRATRAPASSGPRIISSTQRIFCADDHGGEALGRVVAHDLRRRARCRRRRATRWTGPVPGSGIATTPPRSTAGGFTTTVDAGGRVDLVGERGERVAGQRLADVARLLVAHSHRLDDLVVAARARRVVRAVEHQVAPADVEQRVRVAVGGEEQRAQRLGTALERALGGGRGLVHVDPVRRHAHQHVGTRARAQLAAPRGQARRSVARRRTRRGT